MAEPARSRAAETIIASRNASVDADRAASTI